MPRYVERRLTSSGGQQKPDLSRGGGALPVSGGADKPAYTDSKTEAFLGLPVGMESDYVCCERLGPVIPSLPHSQRSP
jgi:hypothetical protein